MNAPIALAICLSGDAEGLILEFEIVLKSILHNAPFQRTLEIYVVADDQAASAVKNLVDGQQIDHRPWRTSVNLHILDVQALTASWRDRLLTTVPRISEPHTFGSFYRLFLADVLSGRSRHVIYTDSDVVFLASTSALWAQRSENAMVCWGRSRCTGVMLINLENFERDFWPLAGRSINTDELYTDQQLLNAIHDMYPDRFRWLPSAWDVHLANDLWRHRDALPENKPAVGYLHFNGGGKSKEAYFVRDDTWAYRTRGWNLASYYIGLPWSWLFYMGEVGAEEAGGRQRISIRYEVFESSKANRE